MKVGVSLTWRPLVISVAFWLENIDSITEARPSRRRAPPTNRCDACSPESRAERAAPSSPLMKLRTCFPRFRAPQGGTYSMTGIVQISPVTSNRDGRAIIRNSRVSHPCFATCSRTQNVLPLISVSSTSIKSNGSHNFEVL